MIAVAAVGCDTEAGDSFCVASVVFERETRGAGL